MARPLLDGRVLLETEDLLRVMTLVAKDLVFDVEYGIADVDDVGIP